MSLARLRGVPGLVPGGRKGLGGRGLILLASLYLVLLLGLPLAALLRAGLQLPPQRLWQLLSSELAASALQLSLSAATLAALINTGFGLLLAWILVRYRFPGRRLADALIDLPFAMPGVVAAIALLRLYGPGGRIGQFWDPEAPFGHWLAGIGITELNLTGSRFGVVLAMVYATLPFVVRAVQPVLEAIEPEVEESAFTLGATPAQTFRKVLLPQLLPALATGFSLALARGLGEYGLVTILTGNIPFETLTSTVYVYQRFEEFDFDGATAVSLVLLAGSLGLLVLINGLALWYRRSRAL
ncbi:sulfate ABC transporter permease subunit CysT [Vulcanococcus limneticus]|uniref:sulfate ABC transporter permease subunit CysT n=1 Tax=Vulcanococcus limneticus TaxID=2170428 RepID=UPI00398BEE8D